MGNRKTAVIHQPDFMPYLGFFHRLLLCDVFIILDHVQYSKGGWHNRDKIKTPEGEKWLTLPVRLTGKSFSPINEVLLNNDLHWRNEHLMQVERCYKGAPGFGEIFPELQSVYSFACERMVDFNLFTLRWLMDKFGVAVEFVFSSDLAPVGKSNEMLVDLLKKVDATGYLSGIGARSYFRSEPFDEACIHVTWQDFRHPAYPQCHGDFIPYLSSLDLLLNCGTGKSREILRSCL